jgi:hypothetical protein
MAIYPSDKMLLEKLLRKNVDFYGVIFSETRFSLNTFCGSNLSLRQVYMFEKHISSSHLKQNFGLYLFTFWLKKLISA